MTRPIGRYPAEPCRLVGEEIERCVQVFGANCGCTSLIKPTVTHQLATFCDELFREFFIRKTAGWCGSFQLFGRINLNDFVRHIVRSCRKIGWFSERVDSLPALHFRLQPTSLSVAETVPEVGGWLPEPALRGLVKQVPDKCQPCWRATLFRKQIPVD